MAVPERRDRALDHTVRTEWRAAEITRGHIRPRQWSQWGEGETVPEAS